MELGARLRALRRACQPKVSGADAARALGWNQATVSRVEAGRRPATVAEVDAMLRRYGVGGYQRIITLAAAATVSGEGSWILRSDITARQSAIAGTELDGGSLRHFQPALIPGLLQTPAYARALAQHAGTETADKVVQARMERQRAVAAAGIRYEAIVDGRVLLGGPADEQVRREQALALSRPPHAPNWFVRVIPVGAVYPRAAGCGFTVCEFRDTRLTPIVWTEGVGYDVYHADPDTVQSFVDLFELLRGISLTESASQTYFARQAGVP